MTVSLKTEKSNIEEVLEAANSIEPYVPKADICKLKTCGVEITVAAFKGSGFCCVDHKKEYGMDVSSVGTIMFVSTEEKAEIDRARRWPNTRLGVMKTNG